MIESAIIDKYFKPLCKNFPGAFSLADDAACISPSMGMEFVVSKDSIVSGVHFFKDTAAKLIAKKLIRVNVSDLVAKGAKPYGYFLSLAIPKEMNESWISEFAKGFAEDLEEFGGVLLGGDTVATNSDLVLSLTAIGEIEKDKMVLRSGAKPGDIVYVSGTIGDSAAGLMALQGKIDESLAKGLVEKYHLPQPRIGLTNRIREWASSSIDISDGLNKDLASICAASGVGAAIAVDQIPLSSELSKLFADGIVGYESIISGGDDYEVLFTISAKSKEAVSQLLKWEKVPVAEIGVITESKDVVFNTSDGQALKLADGGYQHVFG